MHEAYAVSGGYPADVTVRNLDLRLPRRRDVLPEKQLATYQDFYDSARNNDILPQKTTLMLHLAAAMGLGCDP